jgi:hypothetical protein
MTGPRRRRRAAIRVAAGLALGLLAQAAIVLAPMSAYERFTGTKPMDIGVPTQHLLTPEGRVWSTNTFSAGPFGEVLYAQTLPDDLYADSNERTRDQAVDIDASALPRWSAVRRARVSDAVGAAHAGADRWDWYAIEERAEGWPWRCVRGERHSIGETVNGRTGARDRLVGYIVAGNRIRVPWLPIWTGLVLDVGAAAALWCTLAWAAAGWRRRRRTRRGRCPTCGYDLTGIDGVCPECGGER